MRFAVVDTEATGGVKADNRIIEIGIALSNGVEIEKTYRTLIDPGIPVTPFVERLTGIRTEMLQGAPSFSDVADYLWEILTDCVFVAHNVSFDYLLMRAEFLRCAYKLELPRLCTVKLSRKVFPGLAHYNLKSVSEYLQISEFKHHRALADACASAEILHKALKKVGEESVVKMITNAKMRKK